MILECRQVRTRSGRDGSQRRLGRVVDRREIDVTTPVVRWTQDAIHIMADERPVTSVVREVGIPVCLAAELGTGVALLSGFARSAGVHRLRHRELCGCQRAIAGRSHRVDIEHACPWVGDLSIHQAIDGVAGLKDALGDRRALRRAHYGRLPEYRRLVHARPQQPKQQIGIPIRWRAGGDAIEQRRIVLRHHQRLAPAVGAAFEIRMGDGLPVEGGGKCLGRGSDIVVRAQAPVLDLLGVTERPGRRFTPVMAHVAARGDKAVPNVLRQPCVRRRTCIPARSVYLHAAGPRADRRRQPNFEFDLGV